MRKLCVWLIRETKKTKQISLIMSCVLCVLGASTDKTCPLPPSKMFTFINVFTSLKGVSGVKTKLLHWMIWSPGLRPACLAILFSFVNWTNTPGFHSGPLQILKFKKKKMGKQWPKEYSYIYFYYVQDTFLFLPYGCNIQYLISTKYCS